MNHGHMHFGGMAQLGRSKHFGTVGQVYLTL